MKLTKLSILAALALGGLLACTHLAVAQDSGTSAPKKGRMTPEQRMERLTTELNLTDEQKPKVKAVVEDTSKKMQEIPREERRDKMPAVFQEESTKMKAILTPDQYEKYQAMRPNRKGGGAPAEKKSE